MPLTESEVDTPDSPWLTEYEYGENTLAGSRDARGELLVSFFLKTAADATRAANADAGFVRVPFSREKDDVVHALFDVNSALAIADYAFIPVYSDTKPDVIAGMLRSKEPLAEKRTADTAPPSLSAAEYARRRYNDPTAPRSDDASRRRK